MGKEREISIEDYLHKGHENAVTRSYLVALTGYSDRDIRRAIEASNEIILNVGKGYFIYDPETDRAELNTYRNQEIARVKTLQMKLRRMIQKCYR